MFPYRMARKPFFYASTCLILFVHFTAAASFNLSSEFSDFIPKCAEECFISFLSVNYGTGRCGRSPSLQCLCSRLGTSGDTLGEGAVQCIAAERAIGYCSDLEAPDSSIQDAFSMCNGKPGAIQPTRGTITATLVLPPSGGRGVITFPPIPTTSAAGTGLPTSLPTTLVLDTSSSPQPVRTRSPTFTTSITSARTSSTFTSSFTSIFSSDTQTSVPSSFITTFSQTSSSSTTIPTSTDAAGAVGGAGKGDDGDKLNSGQVAGISIGVLAAAGFAIGAILLARYYRRRNHPSIKTGFFPRRDTWGYKPTQSGNTPPRNWVAANISTPLDQSLPPPPPSYNRSSYKPDGIGMAISPAYSRVTPQPSPLRRVSRLLPAKPILPVVPLKVGKRFSNRFSRSANDLEANAQDQEPLAGPSHRQGSLARLSAAIISPISSVSSRKPKPSAVPQSPPRLQIPIPKSGSLMGTSGRESTMTEFEEDGTLAAGEKVWRPPPTTPISATAFYVADQHGNWVLRDKSRFSQNRMSLAAPPTAVSVSQDSPDTRTSFGAIKIMNPDKASPSPTPKKPQQPAPAPQAASVPVAPPVSQATLAPPAEISRMASQSSSVYSQQSAPRPAVPVGSYPLFSSHPNPAPRRSSSLQRTQSQSRNLTRPRENSTSSGVTMIETDDTESDPSPPLEPPNVALSPVAESPISNIIKNSPARPGIPTRDPRRLSQQLLMSKALAEEKKTAPPPTRVVVYQPPGQPSPTLGSPSPTRRTGMASNNVPSKNRRPIENPGLETTGSPTMRVVDPSPELTPEIEEEDISQHVPMQARAPAFFFDPPYPQALNPHRPAQAKQKSQSPPQQQQQAREQQPQSQPQPQQQTQPQPQPQQQLQQLEQQPQLQQQEQLQSQPQRQRRQSQQQFQLQPQYQPQLQPYDGGNMQFYPHPRQQPRMHHQPPLMHDQQLRPYPQAYPEQHRMHPQQQMRMSNSQFRPWPQQSHTYLQGPRPYPQQPYHNQQRHPHTQHPRSSQDFATTPSNPHFPQDIMSAPPQRPYYDHTSSSSSGNSSSTNSSLLAKRLGSERAANMAIPTSTSAKWRRDERDSRTPRTGESNLPSSATWRPTLTPARRGDDLILNVR